MSLFDQMVRHSGGLACDEAPSAKMVTTRTFKATLADQIAYHERKIAELKAVHDSLTPELEKFVEALQKVSL